ncbi:MAG: bifunctional glutamate N-acetyltransferase/amino-acid acetyltransferase ArgJ [Chloroflexi bacterium]|nr:bifunctional glutamate N-acetyltransferase/amino-acid acetyltransferase ArgJ [Chloroflexota bacterium]MDL1885835.1 bifunctional glutamate N-acetyltransferase/amino-acid acetyltransferase ArgJ [Anaerolineae bacterium CFX8]
MVDILPTIASVPGFKVAGIHCGLKKNGALDFALVVSDTPCAAAGVFTTNRVKAAPVLVDMERLKANPDRIRAVVINTGCANACTGQQGIDNAQQTARWVAEYIGCSEDEVLVMSTGVIGTQLPMDKIKRGVELAADSLDESHWEAAARAIMTTDTRPKMASAALTAADGQPYRIAGIAKGAGMIAPNMATMLGLVVTNARFPTPLHPLLHAAAEQSFNRIVVDGDMSTNDTVLLLSNGQSGTLETSAGQYPDALQAVSRKLALDIVRDGEGATKFISILVTGAPDDAAARLIANTIATSALVKTAFFGSDANWGRIVAAAGRSGVPVNPDQLRLWLFPGETTTGTEGGLLLFENGIPTAYREEQAADIMRLPSVSIRLDCGAGGGAALVWTCDLSAEYVAINADYRS